MSATQTPWDGATPSPSQGHDVRGGEQAAAGGAPAGGGEPSVGAPLRRRP